MVITYRKRNYKRYFWLTLIAATIIGCALLIYASLSYFGKHHTFQPWRSRDSFVRQEKLAEEKCIPLCETKECISLASILLKRMDLMIDPCDNFDSFLCGGFKKQLGTEDTSTILDVLQNAMSNTLKGILDNIQAEPESASAKMKIVYESCVDISSELHTVEMFQSFLNELGIINWPNLSPDFQFADTNLLTILGKLMVYFNFLFRFDPSLEVKDGRMDMSISVSFPDLNGNPMLHMSSESLAHILKYFNLDSDEMDIITKDLTIVGNSLLNIPKENCEEQICSMVTVDCSKNISDEWKHFCEFMNDYFNSTQISKYIKKDAISIYGRYVATIRNFFSIMNELPDRTIANFIAIGVLFENMEELNSYFRLTKLKYFQTIKDWSGVDKDRRNYCVTWIAKNLHSILLKEFCNQYLDTSTINEIVEIFDEYRSIVADLVGSQDWIPPERKSFLENTVRNTNVNFLTLKKLMANETYFNTALRAFTENLRFTKGDFFGNVLQIKRNQKESFFYMIQDYLLFLMAYEKLLFRVGASFPLGGGIDDSEVEFGLGLLFPPYYMPGLDKDINLAQLSQLVGHELGHYLHEEIGYGKNSGEELQETYLKKKLCNQNQFSKFKFNLLNENLNGSKYTRENMADSIGLSLLDKISEKYNLSEVEFLLPGLPVTTEQLFFIISNQFWCSKENLKSEKRYRDYDNHAPQEFRLIGMMQNSRKFSEAFHCPVGSYMNPLSKCSFLDYL